MGEIDSSSSVGKGPEPTRVVYALTTPTMLLPGAASAEGDRPARPVKTPPRPVLDEVTKG